MTARESPRDFVPDPLGSLDAYFAGQERQPPHSIESESSVLGALLLDNTAWAQVQDVLAPADFFRHDHLLIFGAVAQALRAGECADVITVFEALQAQGKAEEIGGLPYLNSLAQYVPGAANIRRYAQIVREKSVLRQLVAAADEISSAAFNANGLAVERILAVADQKLADLRRQACYAQPAPRFELLTADDITSGPPVPWLIQGVIPMGGIGAIVGPPGSAKSFLGLSALVAISEGEPWFGKRSHQTSALYIGLEGAAGLPHRIRAQRSQGHDLAAVRFMTTALDIRDAAQRAELIETIEASGFAPGVLLLDTLAQASPGADENSSQDMGSIIAGFGEIQRALNATVVAVHHTGKDSTKGPRGHSSLGGALDFAIEARRDGDRREWYMLKAKDGADGFSQPFTLRIVDLDRDEDGDLITSCVVDQPDSFEVVPKRPTPPSGGNQKVAWMAICEAIKTSGTYGKGPAPAGKKCISLEEAMAATGSRLAVEPKRRNERSREAIVGLVNRGCIALQDEVLWLL